MLVVPDLDRKMRMEINALEFATEGVLSTEYKDKRWRLVAYFSKLLNETERNYKIYNKDVSSDQRVGGVEASVRRRQIQVQSLD